MTRGRRNRSLARLRCRQAGYGLRVSNRPQRYASLPTNLEELEVY